MLKGKTSSIYMLKHSIADTNSEEFV